MTKTYKVTGSQPTLDHQPGETFKQAIPPTLEDFLIGVGALKVVEDKPVDKKPKRADRD